MRLFVLVPILLAGVSQARRVQTIVAPSRNRSADSASISSALTEEDLHADSQTAIVLPSPLKAFALLLLVLNPAALSYIASSLRADSSHVGQSTLRSPRVPNRPFHMCMEALEDVANSFEDDRSGNAETRNPALLAARSACRPFLEGQDFQIVSREPGSEGADLPIFKTSPDVIHFSDAGKPAVTRQDFPRIPGAFLLHNVLTAEECEQIIAVSESMGYTEDAPVSLGRNVRQNDNCVWIADKGMTDVVFQRCLHHLPQEIDGGAPIGLNGRWRLYKYNTRDIFKPHVDGSWPGSGIDPASGSLVDDMYGDRWSQLTWVLYLNDDFEGGSTKFFLPVGPREFVPAGQVEARRGAALCFFHGQHPLSHLHEGALVTKGTKYIIRSDVLYTLPVKSQST